MTTDDKPEETPAGAAPGESGGSHSAPRPVPPLGLSGDPSAAESGPDGAPSASPETTAPETTTSPDAPAPEAPARVSAFPRTGVDDVAGPGRSVPSGPVPASSGAATTAFPVTPPPPATAAIPVDTSTTQTTRIVPAGAPVAAPTSTGSPVPLATPGQLAGVTGGQLRTEQNGGDAPREPLEEWIEPPVKRTASHIWGVVVTLLLVPVAWFLLTDGALRTFYSLQEVTDRPNIAGLLSLAGGLAALVVIALVARASSLGAWIRGGVVAAAGLTVLVIPQTVVEWMIDSRDAFLSVHEGFGTNLYNYLIDTGRSGLLLVFGVVVLLLALVSHASRRSGRTEGRVKAEYTARGL